MDNFTPRRPKQVIDDPARLNALLDEAQTGHLGLARDGEPYVVPVCFARQGETIFVHGSLAGKKIEFLKANPQVCLGVVLNARYVPVRDTFAYESVLVYGRAELLADPAAKRAGYLALLDKFSPGAPESLGDTCIARSSVIAIHIEKLTGKHGFQEEPKA